MNPLSKFSKLKQAPMITAKNITPNITAVTVTLDATKAPPVISSEYVPAPEKCFCKTCKIHGSHPKVYVCACKMTRFGHNIVWLCLDCFNKIHRDPKVEITEVSVMLQAPYIAAAKPPQIPVAKPKLPFKKLTK